MIIREQYLKWLRKLQDQRLIKVITGVRRAGKSTLLELFRQDLLSRGIKKSQIQAYNFEEMELDHLQTAEALHQHIMSKVDPTKMNYIFLDEIQKIPQFEEAIASLAIKEYIDVYITGSNAYLLSGELATYLTGRYISLHILPLSFAEYYTTLPSTIDPTHALRDYITSSSFPEAATIASHSPELARNYLNDLLDLILNRDIIQKYDIRNADEFLRIIRFVLDSIGSPISAKNISNVLSASGHNVSSPTVSQYLEYLAKAYLLYPVNRYDIKGRNILSSNRKYYVVDLGLRALLLGEPAHSDLGHKLENIVFLELLRRNHGKIYIGKQDNSEVDFVVQTYSGELEYYQVAEHTGSSPHTLTRELVPLQKIEDNYPKTLLTLDSLPEDINGIKRVNLIDWLLEEK